MKKYRTESILAPLFKMLEASFELIVPLIVRSIIDRGIPESDNRHILAMCGVLVLLAVVGLASSLTAQYFSAKAATGFASSVRHALMESIGRMSYSELDKTGTSTLITRMTGDIEQVQSGVNLTLRLLLRSPFVVIGAMVMAFTVDVHSALIFTVLIPALSVVIFGIMLITIPIYRRVQSNLDSVSAKVRGNIGGSRVIRAFCREEEEVAEFTSRNAALTSVQRLAGGISALMNPITLVLVNVAVIILIRTGAIRVEAGILTQGSVVALYNYMSQILVELIKMANLIINVTRAVACAGRVASVIDGVHGLDDKKNDATGDPSLAVEFCGASFRYEEAGGEAVSDVSFTVRPGETVGIIGGTGSGKSTLVNLIPRFYDTTDGSVLVRGVDVRNYDTDELRHMIGVVPQRSALFAGTIRENLLVGDPNAGEDALNRAIDTAQARDVIESKPEGMEYILGEGGSGLSGGQRQRLTIARALVRDPSILILDDSASALDYATDARLRRAIASLSGQKAVFIVSQRVSSVRHADKIVVLDTGRVAGIGTHAELFDNCRVYREICQSQSAKREEVAK